MLFSYSMELLPFTGINLESTVLQTLAAACTIVLTVPVSSLVLRQLHGVLSAGESYLLSDLLTFTNGRLDNVPCVIVKQLSAGIAPGWVTACVGYCGHLQFTITLRALLFLAFQCAMLTELFILMILSCLSRSVPRWVTLILAFQLVLSSFGPLPDLVG